MMLNKFDDGNRTYYARDPFEWSGKTTETPWGISAYLLKSEPEPMATKREPHPWFGCANGRVWSQLTPTTIFKTPNECKFHINSEDIYAVNDILGGGYVSWNRHDMQTSPKYCYFGTLFQRRISNGEIDRNGLFAKFDDLNHGNLLYSSMTRSWAWEYLGDYNFVAEKKIVTGTRAQLEIPGKVLMPLGWTVENSADSKYTVTILTLSDSKGEFARKYFKIF